MLPASIPAKMWSDFPTPTLPTRIPALRLRGGGADTVTGVTTDPDQADIGVEPKFISKMLQKQGQKTSKKEAGDGHRNGDYFKPPVPFDLVKGETKEEFAARLKTSFHMLDDDEFYFTFYERFWPQYKADKRLRAARRNEELAPHLQEVFDQDEATTSSWFVPYSNLTRSHLGDFPNASSFVQSRLPKSKFKNASDSAEHALWEACQRGAGDEEIFKLAGEVDDIDAVDPTESNWTAAHFAAERGHVTVVEVGFCPPSLLHVSALKRDCTPGTNSMCCCTSLTGVWCC